ncbi:hypothetical protein K438DRAFT_1761195 [Mycena galopus ATCC 62051]|nr:hypothetical protein K438DRAFT_1761195 [Mycena galopus ATCC 62051]
MALGHARRSYITGGATVPRGEAACVNKGPHAVRAGLESRRQWVGEARQAVFEGKGSRTTRSWTWRALEVRFEVWALGEGRSGADVGVGGKSLEKARVGSLSQAEREAVRNDTAVVRFEVESVQKHTQCSPMRRGQRGEPVEYSGNWGWTGWKKGRPVGGGSGEGGVQYAETISDRCVDFNDGTNSHDTPGVIWIQLHSDQLAANDGGVPRSWILDITLWWRGRSGLPRPPIDAHTGPLTGGHGAPLGHVGGRGTVRERTMIQMRNARADNDENKCSATR